MPQTKLLEEIYEIFLRTGKVTTDSRNITEGSLFFALKGVNFDGNRFIRQALDSGAGACISNDPETAEISEKCFLVKNVQQTLQQLALIHRKKLGIPILAITGSNGKTTTKELLNCVLSLKFRTSVTQGNFNNHIGVPLTLLSMSKDTEFGIVEMGANHKGEIGILCEIAQPDYGVITNIGHAHLEGFGGIDGIISTKGELFNYLEKNNGTAFYPENDIHLKKMGDSRPGLKKIIFSKDEYDFGTDDIGNITFACNDLTIHTHMVGIYNASNIAAALSISDYFGIPHTEAAAAISEYFPDNGRSQRKKTAKNTLILDYYNVNPTSMEASLENFFAIKGKNKTVILGDMFELGQYAEEEHRKIINKICNSGINNVLLVGKIFSSVNNNDNYKTFTDIDKLSAFLQENPINKNIILLKGSRGIALEKIVKLL